MLARLSLHCDGSCEAAFGDGKRAAFGPSAASFELDAPAAGRVRQLTACCVRAHAPLVREALGYRNRLVDMPVLHWHLLSEAEQRACTLRTPGDAIVRWPADLAGCPPGHAACGRDGSAIVLSLDSTASLALAPGRAHFCVRYRAPVALNPSFPHASGGVGARPTSTPWASSRELQLPWAQLFPIAHAPARWRHALALALAVAVRADAADAGYSPLPPCVQRSERSCWPGGSAALLAGLGATPSEETAILAPPPLAPSPCPLAANGTCAGALALLPLTESAAARLGSPALEPSVHSVSASAVISHLPTLPAAIAGTAGTPFERTPLGGMGAEYARTAHVSAVLRAEALICCLPQPCTSSDAAAADLASAAAAIAATGCSGGAAESAMAAAAARVVSAAHAPSVLALVFADESLLCLDPLGQLWARTLPRSAAACERGTAKEEGPQRYAAGSVPALALNAGQRVEIGEVAAEGEALFSRVTRGLSDSTSHALPAAADALRLAHGSLERASRADECIEMVELDGVATLLAYADGHTVARFSDRTVLTLHARAPGEAEEDRSLSAVLPDGSYVRARAAMPVGVAGYASLILHFDRWAHATPAERMALGGSEVQRRSVIAGALDATNRLLHIHHSVALS